MSPLLFVISLIPLTMIVRRSKGRYKLGKESKSINHLLYMDDLKLYEKDERDIDSLVNTVRVFSDDFGMEFGLKNCGVVVMKRRRVVKFEGVDLPDGRRIKTVEEEDYKYLSIVENNDLLHGEMKRKIRCEYFRRLKRVLKSKLSGKNVIMAVNTWAVSVLRYGAGLMNWI